MSRLFYPLQGTRTSTGLLILRLLIGSMIAYHGWGKITNPLHWMGADVPVPGPVQALAALGEFGGGLGLICGALTPLAALGVACTMLGAILMAHAHDPIMMTGKGGAKEPALLYLAPALLFICSGAGRFSVDRLLFGRGASGQIASGSTSAVAP